MNNYCLFTIPPRGKRVVWEITENCNMNCSHCCSDAHKTCNNDFLFSEEKKDIAFKKVDEMMSLGVKEFYISGGEPFLTRDIFSFLAYLKGKGARVSIATNGYLINKKFVKKVSELGIDLLHISIDGHNEQIHNSLRGGDFFKQVVENISTLLDYNVPVRIGCIIWRENEHFLEEMVRFCIELGVGELRLNKLIKVGRFLENDQISPVRNWDSVIEDIKDLKRKYSDKMKITIHELDNKECTKVCPGGSLILFIDSKGRISPCSWIAKNSSQFTSKETIYDKKINKLLKENNIRNFKRNIEKSHEESFYCPFMSNLLKNKDTPI